MLFVDKRYSVDVSSNIVIEYTALRPWRSSRSNIFRSFKILRQDWNIIYLVSTLSNRNSSLENSATRKKGKGNWKKWVILTQCMFFLLAPWSWCNTRTNDIKKKRQFSILLQRCCWQGSTEKHSPPRWLYNIVCSKFYSWSASVMQL